MAMLVYRRVLVGQKPRQNPCNMLPGSHSDDFGVLLLSRSPDEIYRHLFAHSLSARMLKGSKRVSNYTVVLPSV